MGVTTNLLKNLAVGIARTGFEVTKSAKKAVEQEIELARLEDLLKREKEVAEANKHMSQEERERLERKTRNYAINEMAKENAKRHNEFRRLSHKYSEELKQLQNK